MMVSHDHSIVTSVKFKFMWGHFTFDTTHITPLVNGDYEGEGTNTTKTPPPIPKNVGGNFPFSILQCLQGGGFSFSNFTKFSSWTEFHFKILKVHFFQIEGFVFSLHLAIFTIQTAFLHNEMGMFYQKNTFFCVFEPYLNKPQLPLYINCPPPLSQHKLGLLYYPKKLLFCPKKRGQ